MKGKCCEGFRPLGLVLVPAGELTTADLKMRSFANSEIRQDSSTPHLICGVEYLVRCLSEFAPLEPGDGIKTGTPEGVALSRRFRYLRVGDVVEVEIEGIGRARQVCSGGCPGAEWSLTTTPGRSAGQR